MLLLLLLAGLLLPASRGLEVGEAYGEVLNMFSWDLRASDKDILQVVHFALQHAAYREHKQCVNPTAAAREQAEESALLQYGSFEIRFASKHILYHTKDGA